MLVTVSRYKRKCVYIKYPLIDVDRESTYIDTIIASKPAMSLKTKIAYIISTKKIIEW
ncbi:hypothetical protein GCM10007916_36140 [Psychromonas marina]|uniref:Uncharacterized protein n=1 Tax=Psychromonas marina TaxID=88364 RepID=A0ABQ6E513_9GAMM|nr:hypothetical protein GCM10007916_36140 [Psychromonas marina]